MWGTNKDEIIDYLVTLTGTRWGKDDLEKHLQEKFKVKYILDKVPEHECVADYAFIMRFSKTDSIYVYYLKIPFDKGKMNKDIYITEVSISED